MVKMMMFQSSFELTGYITVNVSTDEVLMLDVSKLFRAYGLYNKDDIEISTPSNYEFQSSFELTGYITYVC